MGGCFRLDESLVETDFIANCFYSFFVWMCLCALCHGTKKMLIVITAFAFIYKYVSLVIILSFQYW